MTDRAILVTGGAGFIGSNFVRRAVLSGATVVTLDALTYAGDRATLASLDGNPRHIFVQGSIDDRPLVADLLAEHAPRALVNFAAESHVDRSIDGPAEFVATNIVGVFELLEAVRVYLAARPGDAEFRFVQVSTDEVYGSVARGQSNEAAPLAPNSPYAASKAAADHLARSYFQTYGTPVLVTRSSNTYGPYQFPEKLIPLTISNALAGEPLPVYGDGRQIRDWIHVDDNCAAIAAVLDGGDLGEIYNIGAGAGVENIDIVNRICAVLDRLHPDGAPHARLIALVEDRPGHDRRYALNSERMAKKFDWRPNVALDDGLEATIRWYLDNDDWRGGRRSSGKRPGLAARTARR